MSHSLINEEYPIAEIPDLPLWGENYVVAFHAAELGIGAMFSMGRWAQQPKLWRNMTAIALPQDRILLSRNFGKSIDPKIASSGVFDLEILEPGRKLRYVFDGPGDERQQSQLATAGNLSGRNDRLQFDIVFESEQPIWDMHADVSHESKMESDAANFNSPGGHIEQNGVLNGTIRYGTDEVYKLTDVPATRDHSRGTRNTTRYKGHIWANGHFPDGSSFNVFTMKTHGVDGIAAGRAAIIRDGKVYQAQVALDTEGFLNQPEQLKKPFRLILECPELGRQEILGLRSVNSWPMLLSFPAEIYWGVPANSRYRHVAFVCEQSWIWQWGDQVGAGHLERGNSAFDSMSESWKRNFVQTQ